MMSLETNTNWIDAVQRLEARGDAYVLVTVLGTKGSTPRDMGTKMVFGARNSFGTIGGGHLEYRANRIAATLLAEQKQSQRIETFPLGPSLGQCCGGRVNLLFECFMPTKLQVMLFGAGHVGQSLAPLLTGLPLVVHWVDSRMAELEPPANSRIRFIDSEQPASEVAAMPPDSAYIIMTHNHQVDYEVLRAVLDRQDADFIGLIGSQTKWRRFQMRLEHQGYAAETYKDVHCPIGLSEVRGKRPQEVAISIAAQLIKHYEAKVIGDSPQSIQRKDLARLNLDTIAGES
ncbi:xanthine dehydrogenase accessory protein XdhC [Luminiphilus sp.]|nr:xanthine dehydrogenase accessory protein XdhC [Luminiphilus sp.]MDA9710926.1 xanthine dehydrogenase accessory protein XdhC [Luminiphilus sp.]